MSLRLPLAAALVTATLAACTSRGARVDVPGLPADSIAAPRAGPDQPIYFEFQVETPVRTLAGGCTPAYPDSLRSAGTKGEVVAQFVVDTKGQPEVATFKAVRSAHPAFTAAVREALACMRFTPARIRGGAVRQLVQQPFTFSPRADPAAPR